MLIDSVISEAKLYIDRIDGYVERVWSDLRSEPMQVFWWDERELVMAFYFHLRPLIEELNKGLDKTRFSIIPEYAPKASSYAKKYKETKYPLLQEGEDELQRSKKVDLCIVACARNEKMSTIYYSLINPPR